MSTTSRASRRGLAAAAVLAATVSGLTLTASSPATASSSGLVISEVYGGGGNSGATLTNDFIELYNPTAAAISVDGWSVQYRSAGGSLAGITALSGTVPAGGHYLVQEAAGAGGSTALPTPDASGDLALSSTKGIVVLAKDTDEAVVAVGGTQADDAIEDLVGWGAAVSYETNPAPATSNTTSVARSAGDTDDNSADFVAGSPSPDSTGSAGQPPEPEPDPVDATVAEVQGIGDTSPLAGNTVTVEGVVTAAYPDGGFNGFYLQTPGTPETPGASDAVFVYGSAAADAVAVGDSVEVTGEVSEFKGTTEIATSADGVDELTSPLGTVVALSVPWSDLDTDAEKEAHEGELVSPGAFTVTDNYDTNYYGSFVLAAGAGPLVQPTDVADAQDTEAIAAIEAANAARRIVLDDGASTNFNSSSNKDEALSWLTPANPVRVGSSVTFHQPVVLEERNGDWSFQPTHQVIGDGSEVATFSHTRTDSPEDVGGDTRLATFNVLNYFPTTGEEFVAEGQGSCSFYQDREGNPITVNRCGTDDHPGPRGAANDENLSRQQDKIVAAINRLDASIVSLEEIENSVKFGQDRDAAVKTLVEALNAAAGEGTWAYAPSPAPEDLPSVAEQDVIRTAFIYKPAEVRTVGPSQVLTDAPAFADAREPLAQGFAATGTPDARAFVVIVNHFKSEGSGVDDQTGQGNANPDRIAQAEALRDFATRVAADLHTKRVFLTGDFNSYTQEDPLQVLYAAGYTDLQTAFNGGETTYVFGGLAGSLDHVLATKLATRMVTGADVWQINAEESIAYEYSRFNYNVTKLYDEGPFRASDHDPEIVGLDARPGR